MNVHVVPDFTYLNGLTAIIIALVYIFLNSLIIEPHRQKFNAVMISGAGAAYLSGGLGGWEFVFCTLLTFLAFKGLTNYYYIAIAWLCHTGWDVIHHLYANPIVPFSPSSSAGCAITDTILAIWFFYKAPSVFEWMAKPKQQTVEGK